MNTQDFLGESHTRIAMETAVAGGSGGSGDLGGAGAVCAASMADADRSIFTTMVGEQRRRRDPSRVCGSALPPEMTKVGTATTVR